LQAFRRSRAAEVKRRYFRIVSSHNQKNEKASIARRRL